MLDLKQAPVTKQASVNDKHTDLDDKLFSRTPSNAEMETEQTSVTNVKTETSTMQHLREMTSKCDQDQSPRPTTRRTR